MSFFHKKMSQNLWATIMPFGPVTNILLAQKRIFGPAKRPSFQALTIIIISLIVSCTHHYTLCIARLA